MRFEFIDVSNFGAINFLLQNTPVDHWCRDQPVAPPSECLCPCMWGTLRAQVL